MKPDLALQSMQQLHWGYTGGARMGTGYGWFDLNGWKTYLDIIAKLGQTKKVLPLEAVATNELIKDANTFDHARVERDAEELQAERYVEGRARHGQLVEARDRNGRKPYSSFSRPLAALIQDCERAFFRKESRWELSSMCRASARSTRASVAP